MTKWLLWWPAIKNREFQIVYKTETTKAIFLHYKTWVTLFTSLLNNAINGLMCAFLRDNFLLGQLFYISQRRCMLETVFKEGQEMVVKVLLPAQLRPIRGGLLSRHTTLLFKIIVQFASLLLMGQHRVLKIHTFLEGYKNWEKYPNLFWSIVK